MLSPLLSQANLAHQTHFQAPNFALAHTIVLLVQTYLLLTHHFSQNPAHVLPHPTSTPTQREAATATRSRSSILFASTQYFLIYFFLSFYEHWTQHEPASANGACLFFSPVSLPLSNITPAHPPSYTLYMTIQIAIPAQSIATVSLPLYNCLFIVCRNISCSICRSLVHHSHSCPLITQNDPNPQSQSTSESVKSTSCVPQSE